MEKKHYYGIDWLRVMACIGIVMMHMQGNNKYDLPGFIGNRIIPSFTDFVYVFMMISAFGLCNGYYSKVQNGTIRWSEFYKKRYMKILPFFSLLVLIDLFISFSRNSFIEGFADITLLFGFFSNSISVIGVGWFLGLIFAFYIIFPFYCYLISNKKKAWFFLTVLSIFCIISADYFSLNRSNIVYSLPFFLVGGLIFLYIEEIEKLNNYLVCVLFLISVVCYYIVGANYLTRMIASAMVLTIFFKIPLRKNKVIFFLSGLSMEVYLSHMLIFRIIQKIKLNEVFINDWLQYLFTVLIVLVGAVCFSYITALTIKKINKRRVLYCENIDDK